MDLGGPQEIRSQQDNSQVRESEYFGTNIRGLYLHLLVSFEGITPRVCSGIVTFLLSWGWSLLGFIRVVSYTLNYNLLLHQPNASNVFL